MTTDPTHQATEATPPAAVSDPEQEKNFLRTFGQFLCNAPLYGLSHTVPMAALEESYTILQQILAQSGPLTILLGEDSLEVNGHSHAVRNPLLNAISKRMHDLGMTGLTLDPSLTPDEYVTFARLLMEAMPQAGTSELNVQLTDAGVRSVHARRLIMRAIEEGQMVVDRDQTPPADELKGLARARLVSLLRGETPAATAAEGLLPEADDPAALADSIAEAAAESSISITVADMVRQTADWLGQAPSARTQKGRKKLAACLAELETPLIERLEQRTGRPVDEAMRRQVRDVLAELREELQVEALASDYARKQRAIADAEKRLLRFLKRRGADSEEGIELRERLIECGLARSEWLELLDKSDADSRPAPGDGAPDLRRQLERLAGDAQAADGPSPLGGVLTQVQDELTQLTLRTERRIREFTARARAAGADPETQGRLMRELSEITQELRQPLSVILCTLDMLSGSTLGDLSESQRGVVALSLESGRRMDLLISRLGTITGLPANLTPDRDLVDGIYSS